MLRFTVYFLLISASSLVYAQKSKAITFTTLAGSPGGVSRYPYLIEDSFIPISLGVGLELGMLQEKSEGAVVFNYHLQGKNGGLFSDMSIDSRAIYTGYRHSVNLSAPENNVSCLLGLQVLVGMETIDWDYTNSGFFSDPYFVSEGNDRYFLLQPGAQFSVNYLDRRMIYGFAFTGTYDIILSSDEDYEISKALDADDYEEQEALLTSKAKTLFSGMFSFRVGYRFKVD